MEEEREPGAKPALGADLVIPALALGFAIYFFLSIRGLAWEAKANGVIIGSALVVLVAAQLVRIGIALARRKATLGLDALLLPRAALGQRIALVLIAVAFIATIKWVGVTLGLFAGLYASLWVMGIRRSRTLFLIAFATAALVYILFIAVLDTSFPRGPVEDLLGRIVGKRA